jgi:hypothetical protein
MYFAGDHELIDIRATKKVSISNIPILLKYKNRFRSIGALPPMAGYDDQPAGEDRLARPMHHLTVGYLPQNKEMAHLLMIKEQLPTQNDVFWSKNNWLRPPRWRCTGLFQ